MWLQSRACSKVYRTRDQARADVPDYIEWFYNPRRRHSTTGRVWHLQCPEGLPKLQALTSWSRHLQCKKILGDYPGKRILEHERLISCRQVWTIASNSRWSWQSSVIFFMTGADSVITYVENPNHTPDRANDETRGCGLGSE